MYTSLNWGKNELLFFSLISLYTGKTAYIGWIICFFFKKSNSFLPQFREVYIGAMKIFYMFEVLSRLDRRGQTEPLFHIHRKKNFEKKSCRKWNFSNPIGNPSQIEKLSKKQKNTKKKCVFPEISNCSKIFSSKDIHTFDI